MQSGLSLMQMRRGERERLLTQEGQGPAAHQLPDPKQSHNDLYFRHTLHVQAALAHVGVRMEERDACRFQMVSVS